MSDRQEIERTSPAERRRPASVDTDAGAPAVARAVAILDYLAHDKPTARLSDIAGHLNMNKSTCFTILKSLVNLSLVVRDPNFPVYRLGPRLVELGTAARRGYSHREQIRPEITQLIEEYGVACILAQPLPEHAGLVVVDRILPRGREHVSPPTGAVFPLTVPAMGRVLLATLPFEQVVQIESVLRLADDGDLIELHDQLEEVRARGFGTSYEEYEAGVNAVASIAWSSPIHIATVLCLVGPAATFGPDLVVEAGERLRAAAERIGRTLQAVAPS